MMQRLRTGIGSLDIATGGGLPEGKNILITGRPKSSKTTVTYHSLRQFQRKDPRKAVIIASEGKEDEEWMDLIGVDRSRVEIKPVDFLGVILDYLLDTAESEDEIGFGIVDSLAAMSAERRFGKKLDDAVMPVEAAMTNSFFGQIGKYQSDRIGRGKPLTLLYINHEHRMIGNTTGPTPVTIPRGQRQIYLAATRIRMMRSEYGRKVTLHGIARPQEVEVHFNVVSNLGGPGDIDGSFLLYQLSHDGHPAGYIEQRDLWWGYGRKTGYIEQSGKKFTVGGREVGAKDDVFALWNSDNTVYEADQDAILALEVGNGSVAV